MPNMNKLYGNRSEAVHAVESILVIKEHIEEHNFNKISDDEDIILQAINVFNWKPCTQKGMITGDVKHDELSKVLSVSACMDYVVMITKVNELKNEYDKVENREFQRRDLEDPVKKLFTALCGKSSTINILNMIK